MFFSSTPQKKNHTSDFAYLDPKVCPMDSACQTLRPQCVIDAEAEYYHAYNACGGRVKYGWGKRVDDKVQAAREGMLRLCGRSAKEYAVAFTLNTTTGINQVLHQLPSNWDTIVTSEIEHNSVFVPTIAWAKRRNGKRIVLPRNEDGSLTYQPTDLRNAVVVVNTASNIDGRTLVNATELAKTTHAEQGILLLDAAQTFGHDTDILQETDFDAAFGSAHKMYGPSLGFIIIRRSLLRSLDPFLLGGGTVADVDRNHYTLLSGADEHAILETGLQNWGGIIGLERAITWLKDLRIDGMDRHTYEQKLCKALYDGLRSLPRTTLVNGGPRSTQSIYVERLDSHRLALYLDAQRILCRSGHFCCHSYLAHQLKLPPLLRLSIGLNNTMEQIECCVDVLRKIIATI